MIRLVYRQLRHEPLHALFTCIAIGAVIGVILVLDGFQQGLYRQLRTVVLDRGGDLIVTQAGIANLTAARSTIPQLARLDVEAVPGVRAAYPLTGISVIYKQDGRKNPVFIIVYDEHGGPKEIMRGGPINGPRQIVVDHSLAAIYHLSPGDPFIVSDFRFEVAGVTKDSTALFTPFAFIKYDDLIDFYMESDIAADISTFPLLSYLLVKLEPGADRRETAAAIERAVPAVDVHAPQEIANNDARVGHELFGPILNLLLSVGYVIGLLAIGIVMFTTAHGRRRSLALMRALGFPVKKVAGVITIEIAVLMLFAFPLGIAAAEAIAALMPRIAPVYLVLPTEPLTVLRTLAACAVFAVIGAGMALRLVEKVEPEIAFSS